MRKTFMCTVEYNKEAECVPETFGITSDDLAMCMAKITTHAIKTKEAPDVREEIMKLAEKDMAIVLAMAANNMSSMLYSFAEKAGPMLAIFDMLKGRSHE